MNQIIENTISELERQHSRIALAIQVLKGLNGTRRGRPPKIDIQIPSPSLASTITYTPRKKNAPHWEFERGRQGKHKKKRHMSPEGRLAIQKAIQKMWKRRRAEAKAKKAA